MNILKKIYTKSFSWNKSAPSHSIWTPSTPIVSESNVTQNSAVMACVFWAMRNVGRASFYVESHGKPVDHPLEQILNKPQGLINPQSKSNLSGRELLGAITYSRMVDGNAYVLKVRNSNGNVIGLEWIPHNMINPIINKQNIHQVDYYQFSGQSYSQRLASYDVLHDRDGLNPENPALGLTKLKSVAKHITTDNQIAAYSQTILSNPVPSMIVSTKGEGTRITQADAEYIASKIQESTSRERANRVIVPTFPAEITPIGFKPDDLAIHQLNRLPEERITAVLGIPAIVVGLGAGLDRATYSNMKEAREAALNEFLIPLWQDLAHTFTDQLLPEFGSSQNLQVKYNILD